MSDNISSRLEDYLEAISELSEKAEHAHTKALAERLNVRMSTVASTLVTLQTRGFINYQPHQPVTLTEKGEELAKVIRRRHFVMKKFFNKILKLELEESDMYACRIEHIMSEKVMARFVALADEISGRQDCEGLRTFIEENMPEINPDDELDVIPMSQLDEGQSGIVVRVDEGLRGLKKFSDLGLVRGAHVKIDGQSLFGGLIRFKILSTCMSMRAEDASHFWVRPVDE